MADLICPKCQSPMRSYERNGVTVDQCSSPAAERARVFLDRGVELERDPSAADAAQGRVLPSAVRSARYCDGATAVRSRGARTRP